MFIRPNYQVVARIRSLCLINMSMAQIMQEAITTPVRLADLKAVSHPMTEAISTGEDRHINNILQQQVRLDLH